jgi:hypothetical protein
VKYLHLLTSSFALSTDSLTSKKELIMENFDMNTFMAQISDVKGQLKEASDLELAAAGAAAAEAPGGSGVSAAEVKATALGQAAGQAALQSHAAAIGDESADVNAQMPADPSSARLEVMRKMERISGQRNEAIAAQETAAVTAAVAPANAINMMKDASIASKAAAARAALAKGGKAVADAAKKGGAATAKGGRATLDAAKRGGAATAKGARSAYDATKRGGAATGRKAAALAKMKGVQIGAVGAVGGAGVGYAGGSAMNKKASEDDSLLYLLSDIHDQLAKEASSPAEADEAVKVAQEAVQQGRLMAMGFVDGLQSMMEE